MNEHTAVAGIDLERGLRIELLELLAAGRIGHVLFQREERTHGGVDLSLRCGRGVEWNVDRLIENDGDVRARFDAL